MHKKILTAFAIAGIIGGLGFMAHAHGESTALGGAAVGEAQKAALKTNIVPMKGITELDSASIQCLSNAVDARDTALGAALQAFDQAMIGAYRSRNTQVKAALAIPNASARADALKTATKLFRTTANNARLQWKKGREAAWQTFTAARKECRASLTASQATGKFDDDVNVSQ